MEKLRDIRIPISMLDQPERFGGREDGPFRRGDLVLDRQRPLRLEQAPMTDTPWLLVPGLTEAHVHLDKCHTIDRLGAVGGDLSAALKAQSADKARWTRGDLHHRAQRGLDEAAVAGCTALRSHVDWGDDPAPPLGWHVLTDLAQEDKRLSVQGAALTGIDRMATEGFADAVARAIAPAGGALGAFVLSHDRVEEGLRATFAAADRFGLPLDFHVDEGLGDWNGLEAIADIALETDFEGPILCGHAVSLIDKAQNDVTRIADKLARAGIFVCALPTTNLYLQGRRDGTPDRRGLTRLRELHATGVRILVGSDNVGDAFCPVGQHDPRAALHLACLAAHLDPPLERWLPAITTDAARALGRDPTFVDRARTDDLRLCAVRTTEDFIARRAPLLPLCQIQKETCS